MLSIVKELWAFLRVRKKLWLAPLLIVMLLVGILLVTAQNSALAPFIYTLF
jgi:drug/metabolite transporter superfamily protein YnfA